MLPVIANPHISVNGFLLHFQLLLHIGGHFVVPVFGLAGRYRSGPMCRLNVRLTYYPHMNMTIEQYQILIQRQRFLMWTQTAQLNYALIDPFIDKMLMKSINS